MRKLSTQAPLIREAEERALSDLQKDWRDYFGAKLAKFGAKSPADLDEEKKKEFFNDLKNDWERGKGATEAGKKDIEEHGVKEGEEVNEGRSIESMGKEITRISKDMIELVKVYKSAEGKEKTAVVDSLKKLTAEKKKLENELDELIAGKDKDIELIVMESSSYGDFASIDENLAVANLGVEDDILYITINGNKYGYKAPSGKDIDAIAKSFAGLLKFSAGKALAWIKKNAELAFGSKKNNESMNEAEINTEADFKEYAEKVLKKAHGNDYDESKAQKTIDGILKKSQGDFGAAIGMLTSGLA